MYPSTRTRPCIRLCWGCRISTGAVQPSVAKKVKKKTTHVQGCAAQRIARKTACSLSSLSVFCHCDGDARLGLILDVHSQSRTRISETGVGFLIRLIGCTNTHPPTHPPTHTHTLPLPPATLLTAERGSGALSASNLSTHRLAWLLQRACACLHLLQSRVQYEYEYVQ